jgi:MIP family channel proteins
MYPKHPSQVEDHPDIVPRQPWQRFLAEAIGTFIIIFAGCGAIITDAHKNGSVTLLGITVTFGLAVAAMIYTMGPISAAHFNPAVTIAFTLVRRFPPRYVAPYIGAQTVGALLASGVHALIYQPAELKAARYGATVPSVSPTSAFIFEVVLTFILMLVVMALATDKRVPGAIPGLAIGGTVTLDALCGGPTSGASMNPVRSLAPALFAGGPALQTLWIFLIAPVIGAALGAFCYEALRDGQLYAQSVPADLEEALRREPGLARLAPSQAES